MFLAQNHMNFASINVNLCKNARFRVKTQDFTSKRKISHQKRIILPKMRYFCVSL